MKTLQKLVIGLAIALHRYDVRSPQKSISMIQQDNRRRGTFGLESQQIPELLELASQKFPPKTRIKPEIQS